VAENMAGIVVNPDDSKGFVRAAEKFMEDKNLWQTMAVNGRKYAEEMFDIERITDQFEVIISAIRT